MKNQYRFLARIVIEAQTPLNIGSGNKGIKTDSLVLRDVNGLPFIPGTTIAGLLRHSIESSEEKDLLMGSQKEGSPLIITEAKMLNQDGKVLDGIIGDADMDSEFAELYKQKLPIRQHVKIGHRGVTSDGGKFDEEIVLKGTRFCFEMEMLSDKDNDSKFKDLLNTFASDTFRIGSGSRSGFGRIKVIDDKCQYKKVDLAESKDRKWYLAKGSSLSQTDWIRKNEKGEEERVSIFGEQDEYALKETGMGNWTKYEINGLTPVDFILFGSGFGNDKADMTFVRETFIDWSDGKGVPQKQDKVLLIPGASIKGALSHRVAFHYNVRAGNFADSKAYLDEQGRVISKDEYDAYIKSITGKNNPAVRAIFGSEGEKKGEKLTGKLRGNILISDIIKKIAPTTKPKILNHVSIDRFTGGAIDGALFSEETLYSNQECFDVEILVHNDAFKGPYVQEAFELSLKDLCSGILPLGGGVNRGNGCFEKGIIKRNGEQIYG